MAITQQTSASVPQSGSSTSKSQERTTSMKHSKSNSRPNRGSNTKPSSGNGQTRNEKRARWAKRSKPVARPVAVPKGPVNEYISACCSLPARKPKAGQKESVKNAETGKFKDEPKGLGHWRCTGCGKATKVRPQKPAPKELIAAVKSVESASIVAIDQTLAGLPPGALEAPVATT